MQTKYSIMSGAVGSLLTSMGFIASSNELLQLISLVCTIVGIIFTMIIIPVMNWKSKAMEDGKITNKEILELIDSLQKGVSEVKNTVDQMNSLPERKE